MSNSEIPKTYRDAADASFKSWRLLKKSKKCGCYYCCRVYPASEVVDWCDERDRRRTALCPYCGIDSVIPDASGCPLDEEFLKKMKYWWFESHSVSCKVPDNVAKKSLQSEKNLIFSVKFCLADILLLVPMGKLSFWELLTRIAKANSFLT